MTSFDQWWVHLQVRTCVPLSCISGAAGRIVLKFVCGRRDSSVKRVILVMDGAPISARAQSWGSREHSAEIWPIIRPISYGSYNTGMKKVHLHMSASATAYLFMLIYPVFTSASSSPKRRLTSIFHHSQFPPPVSVTLYLLINAAAN